MAAAIIFGSLAIIVLAYFIAKEFANIAAMKGHTEKKYFWWCFLLGFVGWPMVIALPDRSGAVAEKPVIEDEIPDI